MEEKYIKSSLEHDFRSLVSDNYALQSLLHKKGTESLTISRVTAEVRTMAEALNKSDSAAKRGAGLKFIKAVMSLVKLCQDLITDRNLQADMYQAAARQLDNQTEQIKTLKSQIKLLNDENDFNA